MKAVKWVSRIAMLSTVLFTQGVLAEQTHYVMPDENAPHEGTWLQWPKSSSWRLDNTWVSMTKALSSGENVHIITHSQQKVSRIKRLLKDAGVDMTKVDFSVFAIDSYWVRDNGPIFVYDQQGRLNITDWGFNGWGEKDWYRNDDQIPAKVGDKLNIDVLNLNDIVLEGGAIEIDGSGTLMATRSSTLNPNRNPGLTQSELEQSLSRYLGVSHFIWLDGTPDEDVTDDHIDGIAKFNGDDTIVLIEGARQMLSDKDYRTITRAKNARGEAYKIVTIPDLYVNYYVANAVVLVPTYNDPHNDQRAIKTLQQLYPNRKVVGVDGRELLKGGGMLHCVTQQQPLAQLGEQQPELEEGLLMQRNDLSARRGSELSFTYLLDTNIAQGKVLNFKLSGGRPDADLYVGRNFRPDFQRHDCGAYQAGNNESCRLPAQPGRYFITIDAWQSFADLGLTVSLSDK